MLAAKASEGFFASLCRSELSQTNIEKYLPVVLCRAVLTFLVCRPNAFKNVIVQMEATEQYLCLSCGAIYYAVQSGSRF